MSTPNLGLEEMIAAQAQPHVTVNADLRKLDALVQLAVHDKDLTAPPGSPVDGARYIVASPATGAWAGHEDDIAYYASGWQFAHPNDGWRAYVEDEHQAYEFGTAGSPQGWTAAGGGGGGSSVSVTQVGSPALTVAATALVFTGAIISEVSPGVAGIEIPTPVQPTVPTTRRFELQLAASDLTTDLTTGTTKGYVRAPRAFVLEDVRASLATAGSGLTAVDINLNGSTILPTKLSIDAAEKTSLTAATPYAFSGSPSQVAIADDDEITIDIDTAGTGARGLIVTLLGTAAL